MEVGSRAVVEGQGGLEEGREDADREGGADVKWVNCQTLLFALLITSYLTFPSHATQAHGRFRAISAYLINSTLVII